MCAFSCYCSAGRRVLHSFPTRRSSDLEMAKTIAGPARPSRFVPQALRVAILPDAVGALIGARGANIKAITERSEEHTSELQSLAYLVCRLLLEKKKKKTIKRKYIKKSV